MPSPPTKPSIMPARPGYNRGRVITVDRCGYCGEKLPATFAAMTGRQWPVHLPGCPRSATVVLAVTGGDDVLRVVRR
jgi:hypothetical protein